MQPILLNIAKAADDVRTRAFARARSNLALADRLLHLFAAELRAVVLRVALYGCALAAMGLVAFQLGAPRGFVVAEGAADSEWSEINRPFPAFTMAMPEFDDAPRYAGFRHIGGGGRKDVLTFGGPSGASAVVEIYRPGGETDLDADITTASIGQLRLSSTRPTLAETIDTKFGPVTIEAFADRAPSGERGCVRFSRAFDEPAFEFSGWFCNGGPEIVDHGMIACALDKLSLVSSDPKLAALFARAELKRTFCGTNSVFLAATHKRQDWIEVSRDPRLRGRN